LGTNYRILERNNGNDFAKFIAGLELQTVKDLMRYLHLEFEYPGGKI
jgi:hypothetical protein